MKHTTGPAAQRGFLLVQMAIVVTLLSVVIGYTTNYYWQTKSRDIADDRARLVGSTMAAVDDAVKSYMTTFFTQIQRGQAITKGAYTVPAARVRSPTPADLRDLGMLAARSAGPTVYNGQAINFVVAITVDTSGGCVIPTCNLRSIVSSSTPMLDPRTGQADVRRATIAAATASPGNAGVALPATMDGNPGLFVSHNGSQVGINALGIAGVVGMTNGYESAGFMEFDRRDGSLARTGNINMQDVMGVRHDINEAGKIGTQTLTAKGRIRTEEHLELDGPPIIQNTSCEKNGLVGITSEGLILSCQSGLWKAAAGTGDLLQKPMADYVGKITWPSKFVNGSLVLCPTLACNLQTNYKQYTIGHRPSTGYYLLGRSKNIDTYLNIDKGWLAWTEIRTGDIGQPAMSQPTAAGLQYYGVEWGGFVSALIPWGM